nr:DEAD/DEAH box helicase family protein [Streptococcus oricebi]
MRYPQYFATQAIKKMIANGGKKGVIWHTQGSGKTALTYFNNAVLKDYFAQEKIVTRFFFIVDRLDLATQAKDEFVKRGLTVKLINRRSELNKPFDENIAVVNIQKFDSETDFTDRSGYDVNIQNIYFIDEAHRSYNIKGSFLPNLYQADPNAIKIALTGTPIIAYKKGKDGEKQDRQTTRDIFGDYIHKYYYNQSIADGYTLRLIREEVTTEYSKFLQEALHSLEKEVKQGTLNKKMMFSHPNYVAKMLDYIVKDFEESRIAYADDSIGAMVVADSSNQARELFKQFKKNYPNLNGSLILSNEDDKETRKEAVKSYKNGHVDILFVYNMLLTGFDAPRLKKLYLARQVKAHNLLQTLTRVNRPYKGFRVGYVVDFANITQEFDKTNQAYFEELSKEYSVSVGKDEAENAFGSIFISNEEIEQRLSEAQSIIEVYTTDNLEYFAQEVSEITDRKTLIELRKALQSIKEYYNVARLLEHKDILAKIDISRITQLQSIVEMRLQTLSLLAKADDVSAEQVLNLAMSQTEFLFKKGDTEELELASNSLADMIRKAATELNRNFDHSDPKWLSIYEEFQRILHKQNITEASVSNLNKVSKEVEEIWSKAKEHNRKDNLLLHKFVDDEKYARVYKRETNSQSPLADREILQILQRMKPSIDLKVFQNEGLLQNEEYFLKEVIKIARESMKEMDCKLTVDVIKNLSDRLKDEYIGELQN